MTTRFLALFSTLLVVALFALTLESADAARLGGGRSFGGKPSMSKPFTNPVPSSPTMRQQTTSQAAQPGAAAAGSRGLFGGMGGMLGGLLAGGLLGSLLFGGGFNGGGFLDILLIAGLLYLGFKFFARRKAASAAAGYGAGGAAPAGPQGTAYQATPPGQGGFDWATLGGGAGQAAGNAQTGQAGQSAQSGQFNQAEATFGPRVPAGFDQDEFLQGAKAAYTRLNAAWDKRDLDDIANFATPAMMDELRSHLAEDPKPSQTEIMLVNASIVAVEAVGDEQMASVYFNVLLREDPNQSAPTEIREVWHFVRPGTGDGMWRLDGIQQVA